ncbi:ParA family protein [Haloplasma contractile]|uniref:Sporulation initiation inhibitor protein soj n=1 Tax=Haloplasma contractile SSD-17B TaxID=1033810 RepID=F7PT36_9MOLU|nr:AAA family ATPase [Haloplasma contractile]ERJ12552.1 Sporulation initiation inhibitor protein soj [Haloplasma contractile SSD-17B]
MGKIIAIANQKGGVGKTTTSINLASSLTHLGDNVLVVDIDPQGNATTGLGVNRGELKRSVYDILLEETNSEELIINTSFENLDLIPATMDLAGAEVQLVGVEKREYRLANQLRKLKDKYDYIIIDCPPSLGLLTINALTAADSVIITVQCEYYALEGLTQLLNTIRITQKYLNKNLGLEGVLLTMLDARTNLGIEVTKEVKMFFKEKVYSTIIPRNIHLAESPSHGKPIIEYAPTSKGAKVYLDLAKEVKSQNE